MVKRKRRAAVGKKTATKRGKRRVQGAAARKKAAKRGGRKTAGKKVGKRVAVKTKVKKRTKPLAKRAVRKQAAPSLSETAKQLVHEAARMAEARMVVDIVEESVPGVVVVTEFEEVKTSSRPEGVEGSRRDEDAEEGD
jgi:hypothetical protein